ncbi:MAG: methionyl-tRNA formyltransferase [Pseudomonadota bacterium]
MTPLNIVFAGTPKFAAQHLAALCEHSPHNVVAVYSQPDRPKGRGKQLISSAVKQYAESQGIPVHQPLTLKEQAVQDQLAQLNADIMVVVAYGLILPEAVLAIPRLGCINVHASLLPRWRGAAPIERAIEAGDSNTGVCIMQMAKGLDDGDVILSASTPIASDDSGDSLREKLVQQGCESLLTVLDQAASNTLTAPTPQEHALANYAHKLKKQEAAIDWSASATDLHNKIRAFNSHNVCKTQFNKQTIKLWRTSVINNELNNAPAGQIISVDKQGLDVACGHGVLRIEQLQFPGKNVLSIQDVLNGRRDFFQVGSQFG